MLKRNDLCHCGSGKKYKKCCIDKDKENNVKVLNDRALLDKKAKIDKKYTNSIIKLSHYLEDLIEENEDFAKMEEDSRNLFFDEMVVNNIAANRFFASYFSYDNLIGGNLTPAEFVLRTKKFTSEERNVVASCINSKPSLYEIKSINGIEVIITDLFTKKSFRTLDAKILQGFNVGDYLLGRAVLIDDIFVLIDLTIRIQEETKQEIYNSLIKVYEENKDKLPSIDYLVAINQMFFYKYMLQLLQISDYRDEDLEISLTNFEGKSDVATDEVKSIEEILEASIKDKEILKGVIGLWSDISENINVSGSESGWASGLEYYYRKSIGENTTQSSIAKIYGVSVSTLAKRSKEISVALEKK